MQAIIVANCSCILWSPERREGDLSARFTEREEGEDQ